MVREKPIRDRTVADKGIDPIERRVIQLEDNFGRMQDDVRSVKGDMHDVKSDVTRMMQDLGIVLKKIESLSERDSKRPEPMSWSKTGGALLTAIATFGSLWYAITWTVEHASIDRFQKINDRLVSIEYAMKPTALFVENWSKDGRINMLEDRIARLERTLTVAPSQAARRSSVGPPP